MKSISATHNNKTHFTLKRIVIVRCVFRFVGLSYKATTSYAGGDKNL